MPDVRRCIGERGAEMSEIKCLKMTVVVTDNVATARMARSHRERHRVSIRAVAQQMGISAPYLSDLELARRCWRDSTLREFYAAVDAVRKEERK